MTSDHEDQKEVLCAQLRSKATKNPSDMELYELSQLSAITMDPHVFEILLDLLRKNVSPEAIVHMLRSMCSTAYQQLQQKANPAMSPLMPPPGAAKNPSSFLSLKESSSLSDLHGGHFPSQRSGSSRAVYEGYNIPDRLGSSRGSNSSKGLSHSDVHITSRPRTQSTRSQHASLGQRSGKKRIH